LNQGRECRFFRIGTASGFLPTEALQNGFLLAHVPLTVRCIDDAIINAAAGTAVTAKQMTFSGR
jgi:hypothetical protein